MDDVLLAIDDEEGLLDIIRTVATAAAFSVTVTTDPTIFQSALDTKSPSIVLLDLQMPGCDGIELLRVLADARCRATIILMSGFEPRPRPRNWQSPGA
jgi:DNA-binding response OmpR family regulator